MNLGEGYKGLALEALNRNAEAGSIH